MMLGKHDWYFGLFVGPDPSYGYMTPQVNVMESLTSHATFT